jgi:hypothetical protein
MSQLSKKIKINFLNTTKTSASYIFFREKNLSHLILVIELFKSFGVNFSIHRLFRGKIGKAAEVDHSRPLQSDQLGRFKLTTPGRFKSTTDFAIEWEYYSK